MLNRVFWVRNFKILTCSWLIFFWRKIGKSLYHGFIFFIFLPFLGSFEKISSCEYNDWLTFEKIQEVHAEIMRPFNGDTRFWSSVITNKKNCCNNEDNNTYLCFTNMGILNIHRTRERRVWINVTSTRKNQSSVGPLVTTNLFWMVLFPDVKFVYSWLQTFPQKFCSCTPRLFFLWMVIYRKTAKICTLIVVFQNFCSFLIFFNEY